MEWTGQEGDALEYIMTACGMLTNEEEQLQNGNSAEASSTQAVAAWTGQEGDAPESTASADGLHWTQMPAMNAVLEAVDEAANQGLIPEIIQDDIAWSPMPSAEEIEDAMQQR